MKPKKRDDCPDSYQQIEKSIANAEERRKQALEEKKIIVRSRARKY